MHIDIHDDYWEEEPYISMVGSSYVTGMEIPTGKKAKKALKKKAKRGFGFSQALEQDDE